ncbi:drug/metabolite transporter (DMT)-like permease [Chelatococcus caeni]|uniref:Drug/metabolite transporter (DMT)-like permease n=1 Tax=Chelatococcus caeni TaxID=1348468 RepID=A0A840BWY9_9HYPH|nr:DMT family transporter [Chelatococcus caeni]MBB4015859.1 drug/metabolite transporter (DMT)-like permease [Chelatococcus caeni]
MSERLRGTAEMTAAMVISGTIGWFVVMSGRPVLDVVFWRCVFGAATLLVVCAAMGLLRGKWPLRILGLAALGGVAIVLNWLLLFAAYSRASIGVATVVYNTQPFMLVGLGALLLRERVTGAQLAWLALAFAGMLLIVEGKPAAATASGDYLGGILLALAAAFFYALAAIVARRLAGTPPHLIALVQVCVGILMLAPFADLAHPPSGGGQWTLLATVGVVHTGLMYILLYGALQRLPTHLAGALSFIYPIAAVLVDLLAFGHPLQGLQIAGAAGVLLAAAAMNLGWSLPGRPRRRIAPARACD